jgi:hypothetical protein
MILGAVLGWLIVTGVGELIDTANHNGYGYVTYGDEERGQEVTKLVPENAYKRFHFTYDLLLLVFFVYLWVVVARHAKEDNQSREASKST